MYCNFASHANVAEWCVWCLHSEDLQARTWAWVLLASRKEGDIYFAQNKYWDAHGTNITDWKMQIVFCILQSAISVPLHGLLFKNIESSIAIFGRCDFCISNFMTKISDEHNFFHLSTVFNCPCNLKIYFVIHCSTKNAQVKLTFYT
jgi:hypothetical protein